jgi:threonine dehydrogenase-like Zn-dependent dehydrogenase
VLGPYIDAGDILGHEPMGIVEAVGAELTNIKVGDRVVIPFNISCGHCFMCNKGLMSQCETTQVHEYGTGAAFLAATESGVPSPAARMTLTPMPSPIPSSRAT